MEYKCKENKHFSLFLIDDHYKYHKYKCSLCGYETDEYTPHELYAHSYYYNMTPSWDPDVMKKSEIYSFEMSYVIDDDRYQIIKYSPNKLVYHKTWGGCSPRPSYVEQEADWQKDLECIITDDEDRQIRECLENTEFESWKSNFNSLHDKIRGSLGCVDMPGFTCKFKTHPYIYFKVFSQNFFPWQDGRLQFGEDIELQASLVHLLRDICQNHGIDLPDLYYILGLF